MTFLEIILDLKKDILDQLGNKNFNYIQEQKLNKLIQDLNNFIKKHEEYTQLLKDEDLKIEAEKELQIVENEIKTYLKERIFSDIEKYNSFFLEIKTGVGGLDAQDWSSMLLKMYIKYFDNNSIKYNVVTKQEDTGIKNITLKIEHQMSRFLGEAGVHRLVRISPFNAQKKRQTSFSAIYLYGNAELKNIEINKKDLDIGTFRASGAGGQHVNKTDSAVRIHHIPSGIIVECQNERSQTQNKDTAMNLLKNRLYEFEKQKNLKKNHLFLKENIEWGNQFRSYVLDPYKIIKDKKLDIEIKSNVLIDKVLNGDINVFLEKYEINTIQNNYKNIINNVLSI